MGSLIIIITLLTLALINLTKADIQTNHIISFTNMGFEFSSQVEAMSAFNESLKRLIGHDDIIIDSFTNDSASWHVESIGRKADCPVDEINKVMSSIKKPDGEFTREFKLYLTEDFYYPTEVSVEWLGSCNDISNNIKRNRIESSPSTTLMTPNYLVTSESPPPPGTTPEMKLSEPPLESTTTPEPTTIETPTSDFNTNFSEFGSGFADFGTNTSTIDFDQSNDTSADSLEDSDGSTSSNNDSSNTNNTTTTTVNPLILVGVTMIDNLTITSTTLPSSQTDMATTETLAEKEPSSPEYPTSESPDNSSSLIENEKEVEKGIINSSSSIISDGNNTDNLIDKEKAVSNLSINHTTDVKYDDWPHYGKYIGLTSGFIIIVAYIICSRSYRRQASMYEVSAAE